MAAFLRTMMRRTWTWVVVSAFALLAIVLDFQPLANAIGWEFATVFALPASIAGGCAGIAASRWIRESGRDDCTPWRAFALASPLALAPLVLPIAIGYANALRVRNCTPGESAQFWLLIPVGAALFSCALGAVLGRAFRRHRVAGWLLVAIIVASGVKSGLGALHGPALYFANHFLGFFPGPIYDEVVPVDPALWYLRLLSVLLAIVLLCAAEWIPVRGDVFARAPRQPRRRLAELALVLVAFAIAMHFRKGYRIDVTERDIQKGLGGHVATEHFDIWYDANAVDAKHLALLVEDHEFRWHAVTSFLKYTPPFRVTSYVFPNVAAKKHWTGAGDTQVANPTRAEIYLNDDGYPLPVIEHELTHAVSGGFGGWRGWAWIRWHGIPFPAIGMVEGIAVATSFHDRGNGTPHEQCAAMLADGLLPKPEEFMLPWGFWGDREARAYTSAGSFVRWLADTYGVDELERAYPGGDFEGAFGKSLPALGAEWRTFLATIPVAESKKAAAQQRFTEPSLFERPCARELARLEQDGWAAFGAGHWDVALARFEAWRAVDDRPDPLRAELAVYRREDDDAHAAPLASRLIDREVPDSPGWWRAKLTRADIDEAAGRLPQAADGYRETFEARPSPDLEREAWIKLHAVDLAAHGDAAAKTIASAIFDWLGGKGDAFALAAATQATAPGDRGAGAPPGSSPPGGGTPSKGRSSDFAGCYLIGRNELQSNAPARALPWLDCASGWIDDSRAMPSPALRAETLAMRADALYRLGRLDDAEAGWHALLALPTANGEARDRAADGLARVAWRRTEPTAPAIDGLPPPR